jgi:hypothetical protein
MHNASYAMRESLTAFPEIFGKRKDRFFKSKLDSTLFIDDPNKESADHQSKFYLMSPNPSKDVIHPLGKKGPGTANQKGIRFSVLSIFNFKSQVVPKSLPSRDAYKTFICKGLFTTTHAIQKGSMISPVEKAIPEPSVAWCRSYFERFQLPDRNSVPGSTGIGLAPSLRTLSMKLISSLRRFFAGTSFNFARYCSFSFFDQMRSQFNPSRGVNSYAR